MNFAAPGGEAGEVLDWHTDSDVKNKKGIQLKFMFHNIVIDIGIKD